MSMPPSNPYGSPEILSDVTPSYAGQRVSRKMLKRIDPLSLAIVQGAVFGLLGLIPAVVVTGMTILGAAGGGMRGGGSPIAVGLVGGLIMAVFAPLMYGILGFIGGFMLALVYNLCASFTGGITMEFEE